MVDLSVLPPILNVAQKLLKDGKGLGLNYSQFEKIELVIRNPSVGQYAFLV